MAASKPIRSEPRKQSTRFHLLLGVLLVLATASAESATLTKHKLGPNVNTGARELAVVVSPDGRYLYIPREDEPLTAAEEKAVHGRTTQVDTACKQINELKDKLPPGSFPQDLIDNCKTAGAKAREVEKGALGPRETPQRIFVSQRAANGDWGKAVPLPLRSLGPLPTAVVSALPDNNTLALFGQFDDGRAECLLPLPAGKKTSDRCTPFWLVQRRGSGWDRPQRIDVVDFYTLARRTSLSLMPNLQAMVLDLQRDEGRGARDLYVSTASAARTFSRPVSLGPQVNTAANEIDPTLAADGKTLYFASDRPGGLGGLDLYVTRRLDDGWQHWSAPINLGPEINTPKDDVSIALDATGLFAYMTIDDKKSREDVWEFALPPELRPAPVAFVYGTVHDPAGKPVGAGISYDRLRDGRYVGRASADLKTGNYQIALPVGEHYGFRATAKGYAAVADNIDLSGAKNDARYRRDLLLVPLEPGRTVRLNNLFFAFNQSEPLLESKAELERLLALMLANPGLRIRIEAHTDSVGTDAANLTLSAARAAAVARYLAAGQVAGARVESKGFGESAPAATNESEEGRALNRRVEFRILSVQGESR